MMVDRLVPTVDIPVSTIQVALCIGCMCGNFLFLRRNAALDDQSGLDLVVAKCKALAYVVQALIIDHATFVRI